MNKDKSRYKILVEQTRLRDKPKIHYSELESLSISVLIRLLAKAIQRKILKIFQGL